MRTTRAVPVSLAVCSFIQDFERPAGRAEPGLSLDLGKHTSLLAFSPGQVENTTRARFLVPQPSVSKAVEIETANGWRDLVPDESSRIVRSEPLFRLDNGASKPHSLTRRYWFPQNPPSLSRSRLRVDGETWFRTRAAQASGPKRGAFPGCAAGRSAFAFWVRTAGRSWSSTFR